MATSSEVKTGLDAISAVIANARKTVLKAQTDTFGAVDALNSLPSQFADVINTINAYGTADAFEALSKAELAKLTTEFLALVTAGNTIVNTEL